MSGYELWVPYSGGHTRWQDTPEVKTSHMYRHEVFDNWLECVQYLGNTENRSTTPGCGGFIIGSMQPGRRTAGKDDDHRGCPLGCEKVHRNAESVVSRNVVCLDFDTYVPSDFTERVRTALPGVPWVAYTTKSHDPKQGVHKWRVLIPLESDLGSRAYTIAVRRFASVIGRQWLDVTCQQHSRLFFPPLAKSENVKRSSNTAFGCSEVEIEEEVDGQAEVIVQRQMHPVSGSSDILLELEILQGPEIEDDELWKPERFAASSFGRELQTVGNPPTHGTAHNLANWCIQADKYLQQVAELPDGDPQGAWEATGVWLAWQCARLEAYGAIKSAEDVFHGLLPDAMAEDLVVLSKWRADLVDKARDMYLRSAAEAFDE